MMFVKIITLFRVTAVRLSLIYTLIFGAMAVGIVFYMTGATVNVVRKQYQASIDTEVADLSRIYSRGGLNFLARTLDRRARAPNANLYILVNPQGEIIAGNVPKLQNGIIEKIGWTGRPFKYERYENKDGEEHRAIARILEIPNGMRLLVGRDILAYEGFRDVVGRGFKLALAAMVALGLLTWFFVGRRALKRIDQVSKTSRRIMSGDKSERLPITGSDDEYDRLSENLNHMLDKINGLDEGVKQMSDNIAHDLKTPITRLRNQAEEAFSLEKKPQEQQDAIARIIDDCDNIVKTFDALLMISRVESGSTVAKMESLKLSDILTDVYELYEAVVEDENKLLKLENNLAETKTIKGNRELLSQAISNLLDNAIKYGGNELILSARVDKTNLIVEIADNGVGIPKEDQPKVVERFVRLDKSRKMVGNGLGLSMVKAIAEFHQGSIKLQDNEPGLIVTLKIPL